MQGSTYGYGVYDDSRTTWRNAEGYLPALVTSFDRDGAHITITNFGDRVTIGGHAYVVVYSRVRVQNPTGHAVTVDPQAERRAGPAATAAPTRCPRTARSITTTPSPRTASAAATPCRARPR